MAAVASQVPTCFLSGITSDNNFQPLNDCGVENPFFYHQFYDDFDLTQKTLGNSYTVTVAGTGAAVAAQAGVGGQVLFTAGTTAGSASIQLGNATFGVNIQPKKLFFVARIQAAAGALTDTNIKLIAGLIQTTTTPGTVTDGIWFQYTNGVLTINNTVTSVTTSATIPAAAFSTAIVGATFFDLAFFVNRAGDIMAYVDTQLVGYVPQANLGSSGNPQNVGPVARLTPASFTTVTLNPTLAIVQASTAAGRTMTADFFGAFAER